MTEPEKQKLLINLGAAFVLVQRLCDEAKGPGTHGMSMALHVARRNLADAQWQAHRLKTTPPPKSP